MATVAEQVDWSFNPTQNVSYGNEPQVNPQGPAQPTFAIATTDFWAQSQTVGINFPF